jgi:hypothetical protein
MTPLLFAAALAVSPATPQPDQAITLEQRFVPPGQVTRLPGNLSGAFLAPPSACAKLSTRTVAPDGVPMFKRLDQLPWGVLEHAVWRSVGGCPVREIVFGGQTYYLASANPQIERLDPAAR